MKKLTREQQKYIAAHAKEKTAKEIAEVIGCTPGTVNRYAVKLGARAPRFKMDGFRGGGIADPPRTEMKRPNLHTGDVISVTVKEEKGEGKERRQAEVVEVYKKFCILQVQGRNGGKIRVTADYFDLATKQPIVI